MNKFRFLAKPSNLAWLDDSFHLHGQNYYIYTCSCGKKQVKKGIPTKEVLNWGGKQW